MSTLTTGHILIERQGAVGVLTLNRPGVRNALTPTMMYELAKEATRLAANSAADDALPAESSNPRLKPTGVENDATCRALVLTGAGKVFCAGFDLRACARDETMMEGMLRGLAHVTRTLRRLPIPVIAAAHGAAVAGGCALLGGCDIVVTNSEARLGYPALRIGISPAVTAALFRTGVGDGKARQRQLDTRTIDGEEALRIGLAHECCDNPHEVRDLALQIGQRLAELPLPALRETKMWLSELDGSMRDDLIQGGLNASLKTASDPELRARLLASWGGASNNT